MRNRTFFVWVLQLVSGTGYAQTVNNTNQKDEQNIYHHALTMYLKDCKEKYSTSHKTLLIEEDKTITKNLLLYSDSTTFVILDYKQKEDYMKEHKQAVIFKMLPLSYENGEFSVSFIPFSVNYKRKGGRSYYDYINGGGYSVFYKFEDNQFVFLRIKQYGI